MRASFVSTGPLPGARFGGRVCLPGTAGAAAPVDAAEADPAALPRLLAEAGGVLLLPAMGAMAEAPGLLLRLSRVFGPEVENYRTTGMAPNMVHPAVPEIFIVSNTPPVSRPPPKRPDPPFNPDGSLPVQFPHRRGWHTDQSYRRPPPDISLFLAVVPVPRDQRQTLFADGTAAYAALPPALKARVDGVHEWTAGDLVVRDNRCTVHAATRFDAERLERVIWRTTVGGNPGPGYAGERPSWLAAAE